MKQAKDTIYTPDPRAHHFAYLTAFGEEGEAERFRAVEQAELAAQWAEPEPSDGEQDSYEEAEEGFRLARFWGDRE